MDKKLTAFLDDLYERGREHDAKQSNRLDRWRNLEPETARLLALLVRALKPRRLLEIGTSNGYSTIWLADAATAVNASMVSVDIVPDRSVEAHKNIAAADLLDAVDLRIEDAALTLSNSERASWEFILLDAERSRYTGYWPDLARSLAPNGLLAVDNAISHAAEMEEFREIVAADPRVVEALCPIGAGVLFVVSEGSHQIW